MVVTPADVRSAIQVLKVMADTIRELKSVPSGELYALVMGHMSLDRYNQIIDTLCGTKLVKVQNNVVIWCEPS